MMASDIALGLGVSSANQAVRITNPVPPTPTAFRKSMEEANNLDDSTSGLVPECSPLKTQ